MSSPELYSLPALGRAQIVPAGLLLLVLIFGGCIEGPRQVRMDLIVRGSCGRSTLSYDTSCVASLLARVRDAGGEVLDERCTAVAGQFSNINDLVTSTTILELLETDDHKQVYVEFNAYHAFDKSPCSNLSDNDLMLWGSTDLVDLNSSKVKVVTVELECRPECDCEAFDESPAQCPASLPAGACTPLATLNCRRSCQSNLACYEGLLTCSNNECAPLPRGLCALCGGPDDCDSGLCVENTVKGDNERFCAPRCPPLQSSTPCPPLMSCKRLGGDFVLVPE